MSLTDLNKNDNGLIAPQMDDNVAIRRILAILNALASNPSSPVLNVSSGGGGAATSVKIVDSTGANTASVSVAGAVKVDGSGVTQPISAASLPLPTGAATEATLSTLNGKITACDTGAVTVASCALPTGAATSALQGTGNTSLASIDGKITACNTGAVVISSSALPTGAATEATLSTLNGKVTACNTGAVTVSSSALPTGAATSALQGTGNTSLSSIDGKITACNTGAVTISTALPAGTNAIGKLAANSGVDIGDVDITSVIPGTGATNLGKAVDAVAGATDTVVAAGTVRKDTPATLTPADGDYSRIFVDNCGRLWINPPKAATPTVANVTGATTNTTVLAANGNRLKWGVYNSCSTTMYLKLGATASTTSYTVKILPEGYYEDDVYTGIVDAVWATGVSGDCRVTSLVS